MCRPLRGQARSHRDGGRPWDWRSLQIKTVGASLLAIAACLLTSLLNVPPSSRASPLPQGWWSAAGLAFTADQNCGSELARDSGLTADIAAECAGLFAGKPAPTGMVVGRGVGGHELARDSGLTADIAVECAGLFAGKPAPTGMVVGRGVGGHELTRDSGLSADIAAECAGLFAGKPAPTGMVAGRGVGGHCRSKLWERACSR
jgi:hypothetical protein